jgi:hypothetical protein
MTAHGNPFIDCEQAKKVESMPEIFLLDQGKGLKETRSIWPIVHEVGLTVLAICH